MAFIRGGRNPFTFPGGLPGNTKVEKIETYAFLDTCQGCQEGFRYMIEIGALNTTQYRLNYCHKAMTQKVNAKFLLILNNENSRRQRKKTQIALI